MRSFIIVITSILAFTSTPAWGDTTDVGGIIDTSTTWTSAGNPHIVTANTIIDSNILLTIEPGVKIEVSDTFYIIVKGILCAKGTEIDSIKFTSKEDNAWGGLIFEPASVGSLRYCQIEYACNSGVRCNSATVTIEHSTISNNSSPCYGGGIYVYSGSATITNSAITYNSVGGRRWCSEFEGCGGGISVRGSATISNNLIAHNVALECGYFTGYGGGIHIGGFATIDNNTIWDNGAFCKGGGIHVSLGGSVTITNNTISDNYTGFEEGGGSIAVFGSATIAYNTITDNSSEVIVHSGDNLIMHNCNIYKRKISAYAFYNQSAVNIDATYNYWGTADTNEINAMIYDYHDNPDRGEVFYNPFLISSDTSAPVPPPLNLTATVTGIGEIALSWDSLSLADLAGYRVYYDTLGYPYAGSGANEGPSPIDVGKITNFRLTGLIPEETYHFAVTAYDNSSNESWYSEEIAVLLTSVKETGEFNTISAFSLVQGYPNPTSGKIVIRYIINRPVYVKLNIFDAMGNLVKTLVKQRQPAGCYSVLWTGRDDIGIKVASGVYFCVLEAGLFRISKKLIVLK